jgi:hypothetical protein
MGTTTKGNHGVLTSVCWRPWMYDSSPRRLRQRRMRINCRETKRERGTLEGERGDANGERWEPSGRDLLTSECSTSWAHRRVEQVGSSVDPSAVCRTWTPAVARGFVTAACQQVIEFINLSLFFIQFCTSWINFIIKWRTYKNYNKNHFLYFLWCPL